MRTLMLWFGLLSMLVNVSPALADLREMARTWTARPVRRVR